MDVKLQEAEWVRTRYEELSLIEEKRLAAICHGQLYQQRMKRDFDRKVRPRVYHVGDMVLKRILPPQNDRRGKWTPNYEGPFVVKKVFSGGALLLTTMDGEDFPSPVNVDAVLMWKLLTKDPRGVQSGTRDRRMVKRRRRRTTILDINQEDSSKSEDWRVRMNPRSSLSGEYGEVGNTRVGIVISSADSRVGIVISPASQRLLVSPQSELVVLSPAKSPSGSGAEEVIPGEGGLFPSSSVIPQQGGDRSVGEFLSRVPRAPRKSPLRGIHFYPFIM
ncbi:hypothetical protein KIW84_044487 [Lathyrus oleraceus]|uniref:Uncharacterized protein n=1 Tax=Pisum sativum TaxID=3888 RepID=A0A9D5AVF3_PEA|nr:hypothetical protein KIW84_044487 [Pisum sativum]